MTKFLFRVIKDKRISLEYLPVIAGPGSSEVPVKEMLDHLADQILDLDGSELSELLPQAQVRMENCDLSRDWERSVITFFLINGMRFKCSIASKHKDRECPKIKGKSRLRLVK